MKYIHGGDIYKHAVAYDFSVNINPLGMPKGSVEAVEKSLPLLQRYPDYNGSALKAALAEKEGVRAEQILLGNGAAELIYTLCFALRPKKVLVTAPAFQEYELAAASAGAVLVVQKLRESEDFLLHKRILEKIDAQTDLVFLCNPNNPTGCLAKRKLLRKIAQKCEDTKTYFCLDECFLPFLYGEAAYTLKGCLAEFPHLIILRAFTKIYGMPALRLGYALSANQKLLEKLRVCLQPWNTSLPAQMAGLAALKDEDYLVRTKHLLEQEKAYLLGELQNGLAKKVYASSANYLFFQSEKGLWEKLLAQGVLIRSCANYRNLSEGYYRIGIRTHEENAQLIARWKQAILEQKKGE